MRLLVLAALFLLLLSASPTCAHVVGVECKVRGDQVQVSAYYDDDTDAADAQVRVLEGKREIAAGKTDDKGVWTFPTPPPGKYQVIVDAGAGHGTKTSLTIRAPAQDPTREEPVSPGPTRRQATRYPWLKVGLGLGILGLLTVAFFLRPRKS